MKGFKTLLIAGIAMFASSFSIAATVTNGGFETGDLTGWTVIGADLASPAGARNSGLYAFVGFDNSGFSTLSQDLSTDIGSTYELSFYSMSSTDSLANILRVDISGDIFDVTRTLAYGLTSIQFTASSALTSIGFLFETDPGTGVWYIDDISATQISAVPVPAAAWLFGTALLGLAGFRRKQLKAA